MDGVNLTTEVVYKKGQDYRFVCYDRGRACQTYRVRFLCGKPGKQLLVGDTNAAAARSRGRQTRTASSDAAGSAALGISVTRCFLPSVQWRALL